MISQPQPNLCTSHPNIPLLLIEAIQQNQLQPEMAVSIPIPMKISESNNSTMQLRIQQAFKRKVGITTSAFSLVQEAVNQIKIKYLAHELSSLSKEQKIIHAIQILQKSSDQRSLIDHKFIEETLDSFEYIQKMRKYNNNLSKQVAKVSEHQKALKGHTVFFTGQQPEYFYLILRGKVAVLIRKSDEQLALDKKNQKQAFFPIVLDKSNLYEIARRTSSLESNCQQTPISIFQQDNHLHINKFKREDSMKSPISESPHSPLSSYSSRLYMNNDKSIGDSMIEGNFLSSKLESAPKRKISRISPSKYSEKNHQDFICEGIDIHPDELQYPEKYFDCGIFQYNYVKNLQVGTGFGDIGLLLRMPRTATILAVEDTDLVLISKQSYSELIKAIENLKLQKKIQFFHSCIHQNLKIEQLSQLSIDFSQKKHFNSGQYLFQEDDSAEEVFIIKKGDIELNKEVFCSDGKSKKIKFSLIGKSEIIGIEEIFYNQDQRYYSARCRNKVTVYFISRNIFIRLMYEIPALKQIMMKRAMNKLKWQEFKIEEIINQQKQDGVIDSYFQVESALPPQRYLCEPVYNHPEEDKLPFKDGTKAQNQQKVQQENQVIRKKKLELLQESSDLMVGPAKLKQIVKEANIEARRVNHKIDEGKQDPIENSIKNKEFILEIIEKKNTSRNSKDATSAKRDKHVQEEQPTFKSGIYEKWFDMEKKRELQKKIQFALENSKPTCKPSHHKPKQKSQNFLFSVADNNHTNITLLPEEIKKKLLLFNQDTVNQVKNDSLSHQDFEEATSLTKQEKKQFSFSIHQFQKSSASPVYFTIPTSSCQKDTQNRSSSKNSQHCIKINQSGNFSLSNKIAQQQQSNQQHKQSQKKSFSQFKFVIQDGISDDQKKQNESQVGWRPSKSSLQNKRNILKRASTSNGTPKAYFQNQKTQENFSSPTEGDPIFQTEQLSEFTATSMSQQQVINFVNPFKSNIGSKRSFSLKNNLKYGSSKDINLLIQTGKLQKPFSSGADDHFSITEIRHKSTVSPDNYSLGSMKTIVSNSTIRSPFKKKKMSDFLKSSHVSENLPQLDNFGQKYFNKPLRVTPIQSGWSPQTDQQFPSSCLSSQSTFNILSSTHITLKLPKSVNITSFTSQKAISKDSISPNQLNCQAKDQQLKLK